MVYLFKQVHLFLKMFTHKPIKRTVPSVLQHSGEDLLRRLRLKDLRQDQVPMGGAVVDLLRSTHRRSLPTPMTREKIADHPYKD